MSSPLLEFGNYRNPSFIAEGKFYKFSHLDLASPLQLLSLHDSGDRQMVLRIEKVSDGPLMILRSSRRLQSENVDQLKAQIEGSTQRVTLNLEEVKRVDRDVVRFLGLCETNGVELRQCSPYIRDWIERRASQGDS